MHSIHSIHFTYFLWNTRFNVSNCYFYYPPMILRMARHILFPEQQYYELRTIFLSENNQANSNICLQQWLILIINEICEHLWEFLDTHMMKFRFKILCWRNFILLLRSAFGFHSYALSFKVWNVLNFTNINFIK